MINNYTFRMILNEQISDFYGEGHLNIILILHLGMWRKKEVTVTSQVSFANSIASLKFIPFIFYSVTILPIIVWYWS